MDDLKQALSFAIDKEKEAESFYRTWAERADEPGVKALFNQLAGMEQGHVEKLSRVSPDQLIADGTQRPDMRLSEAMVSVRAAEDMSLQEAFVLAMKREEASAQLYRGFAELGGPAGDLFNGLEREERRHKLLLEQEYDAVFLTDN